MKNFLSVVMRAIVAIMFVLVGVPAPAQTPAIQGKVVDETRGPLPGVTVEARPLSGGKPGRPSGKVVSYHLVI